MQKPHPNLFQAWSRQHSLRLSATPSMHHGLYSSHTGWICILNHHLQDIPHNVRSRLYPVCASQLQHEGLLSFPPHTIRKQVERYWRKGISRIEPNGLPFKGEIFTLSWKKKSNTELGYFCDSEGMHSETSVEINEPASGWLAKPQ